MTNVQGCQPPTLLRPIPVYGQREIQPVNSLLYEPWKTGSCSLTFGRSCPITAFMAVQNHIKAHALEFSPAIRTQESKLQSDQINKRTPEPVYDKESPDIGPLPTSPLTFPPYLLPNNGQFISQFSVSRKIFPCPECRYTTDRRNNLKRHMLTMHRRCSKLMECCGVFFTTKASLREHSMIFHYHGYTCFYCGRRFCRKALLKRHLSVHNGQKDFVCPVCDYATSHKSNLERHRKIHVRSDDASSTTTECEETRDCNNSEAECDVRYAGDSNMLSENTDDEEIDVS